MRSNMLVLLLSLLATLAVLSAEDLLPAPLPATMAPIRAEIERIHPDAYGRRSTSERAAFAATLLELAETAADKPEERYTLLREAVAFASRSGEVSVGLSALATIQAHYRVAADADLLAFASDTASNLTSAAAASALIDAVLGIAEHAIQMDDYSRAQQAGQQADAIARRLKDRTASELTRAVLARVKTLDRAYRELGVIQDALGQWTADGHHRYGWFACVVKQDWQAGLPHLAQGDDESLKALATLELAVTNTANNPANNSANSKAVNLLAAADAWYALAQDRRGDERAEIGIHAAQLYRRGSVGVSGLEAARVEHQLEVLAKELGPRLRLTRYPPGAVLIVTCEPETITGATIQDQSAQHHQGRMTGVTPVTGPYGTALRFDGTARVDFPNHPSLQIAGDLTLTMWLAPDDLAARRNPFNKCYGGEGTLTLEPTGNITFYQGTAGRNADPYKEFTLTPAVKPKVWTYVTVVRDMTAKTMIWYVNGTETVKAPIPYPKPAISSNDVSIGNGYAGGFVGLLDEIALYPRVLTPAEIQGLYTATMIGRQ